LKKVIKSQKGKSNFRLAALAVAVRTAKFGHFDKVIGEIDKILKLLAEEGQADIEKKDECKEKYQIIDTTVADLEWKIKNNLAKIAKLESLIEKAEEEVEAANARIKETKEEMKEMTDTREDENDAFKTAKKEDEDAIALLEDATKALAKFYKKNGVELGKIQGGRSGEGFLQEEPVFERSEDDAPDATFSDKGSRKMQSKNILSILAYITEDLYDEIEAGKRDEEKSQLEYEAAMDDAQKLVDDLTEKVDNLKDSIADMGEDKKDENKAMKQNEKEKKEELDYEAEIKPDCDWIIGAFTKRADARAAEIAGLTSAKEYLAGMAGLIETGKKGQKKFDDTAFSKLGFLHIK